MEGAGKFRTKIYLISCDIKVDYGQVIILLLKFPAAYVIFSK
jgi:hypothetical protein